MHTPFKFIQNFSNEFNGIIETFPVSNKSRAMNINNTFVINLPLSNCKKYDKLNDEVIYKTT